MEKRVIKHHDASYPDPIAVQAGDVLRLSGKTDDWNGYRWLWAEGPDGRQGWIAEAFVVRDNGMMRAARDYSAAELTCRTEQVLQVLEETHGWSLCRSETGEEGWVPQENLSQPL